MLLAAADADPTSGTSTPLVAILGITTHNVTRYFVTVANAPARQSIKSAAFCFACICTVFQEPINAHELVLAC
jgi:hypothetical protein